MKKCILVPDSFKGTMSSLEVSEIMKKNIVAAFPDCQVIAIPVADGGEGTVDCFLKALGGEKVFLKTSGPFGDPVDSFYGIIGKLAVIEMAASAGLHLARGRLNPLQASTYGVGELILDAFSRKCTSIVIGLGGSCTNDAGTGMAAALGARFFDKENREFLPVGGTLGEIVSMELTQVHERLKGIQVIAMCDIDNPLFGVNGAAYIYGPQKGASQQEVIILDKQLQGFSKLISEILQFDVSTLKGAGAAGGMGAGVKAFLGGELKQGIDAVLDLVNFEGLLADCDYVFTGEGRLDAQSLSGKVVIGVANRAVKEGVPVIAVVGEMEDGMPDVTELGVTEVYETSNSRSGEDEIRNHCREDLDTTMKAVLKAIE